jgi:hypothetical protein
MKHSLWLVGVCGLFLACGAALVIAAPGAKSGSKSEAAPATQPTAKESLADGAIEFARPADWTEVKGRRPLAAGFISPDRKGMITVEVWPQGDLGPSTGAQTVKLLRETRRKQTNLQIVMEPKLEPDKRFPVRIHEQYKAGDATEDVLRLYRQVGPKVVMVTVNSKSPDDARDRELHQTGEEVSLSATFTKVPPKPTAKPPAKPAKKP